MLMPTQRIKDIKHLNQYAKEAQQKVEEDKAPLNGHTGTNSYL